MKKARVADLVNNETERLLLFRCPGCHSPHRVRVRGPEPCWTWNGDAERPTFSPSILVAVHDRTRRCHSFVEAGRIRFLSDCHHALAGLTVELPAVD